MPHTRYKLVKQMCNGCDCGVRRSFFCAFENGFFHFHDISARLQPFGLKLSKHNSGDQYNVRRHCSDGFALRSFITKIRTCARAYLRN